MPRIRDYVETPAQPSIQSKLERSKEIDAAIRDAQKNGALRIKRVVATARPPGTRPLQTSNLGDNMATAGIIVELFGLKAGMEVEHRDHGTVIIHTIGPDGRLRLTVKATGKHLEGWKSPMALIVEEIDVQAAIGWEPGGASSIKSPHEIRQRLTAALAGTTPSSPEQPAPQ